MLWNLKVYVFARFALETLLTVYVKFNREGFSINFFLPNNNILFSKRNQPALKCYFTLKIDDIFCTMFSC